MPIGLRLVHAADEQDNKAPAYLNVPISMPVVFPLFGIVDGKCACGKENCSRVGKHPRVEWGELKYGDAVPRPEHGAGAGLKTGAAPKGSDVVVVDLDGPEAEKAFEALGECPDTYTVSTPRGWHLYFQHPGFRVPNSAGSLAKGVDIRGDGGFVVACGSPHRSGGEYTLEFDDAPAPLPEWLRAWLEERSTPASEAQAYPGDVTDPEELAYRKELYAAYCREASPAPDGQRYGALFPIVQRGAYDLALPTADVFEIVAAEWNPRCQPPLEPERLRSHVLGHAHGAKTGSTRPRMEPLPRDLAHLAITGDIENKSINAESLNNVVITSNDAVEDFGERWGGWDEPIAPPSYLLEGLIPEHKVCTLFAEGGSVKTWSALALAIAVATGEPWLGKYTVRQGLALYLDYEDGPYEFQRRVHMLTGGRDVPNLGYLYGGPQIHKPEFWLKLARLVKAKGIALVIADSLGAAMPANADENDTTFSEGIKLAGRFTEVGCTIVFIHHANKSGGLRGTSTIHDQSDVVFKFEAVDENDVRKRMRMVCVKPGPQRRPAPVNVELTDAGLSTFDDEAFDKGRNAQDEGDVREAVRLALAAKGPIATKELVQKAVGKKRNGVYEELNALIATGDAVKLQDGFQLDDDTKRSDRVLRRLKTGTYTSASKLAKAANVDTKFVDDMMCQGRVKRSAEGSLLEVTF